VVTSAILDSGNEFIDILTRDPGHSNFTFVAGQLGCGDLAPDEELACMRTVPASAINDFLHGYYDASTLPTVAFSPIIDNHTIYENYTLLAQNQHLFPLPALLGSNAQDGIAFIPYSPFPSATDLGLADYMTSFYFFCPAYLAARTRLVSYPKTPVYRYLYSGNFTDVSPKGWMGAYHGAELPMVFGTWDREGKSEGKGLERATSEAMQDVWVRFVGSAGRETGVEGWEEGKVVEFGRDLPVRVVDVPEMEKACA
jgi:carboxylesterase type B